MYMLPDMIYMGLINGQEFPTNAHKRVAVTIAICNPQIKERDKLIDIVQAVIKVPNERIKKITYNELVKEFEMPDVGIYK